MAQIVNVTDTFSFWREQFNALVGEVGAKRYFKTPQDFGAVGDPAVNDTAAFDLAQNQPFPVYIPPGVYNITKNYTGANKFFEFGGVTYVGGGSVVPGFSLNATGNLQLNKNIFGLDPTNPQHLSTKNYVDEQVSSEASARASTDANLQNQINLIPTQANWYNNGILRVKTDGGTELGNYVDFHSTSTSSDFDIRVDSFFGSDANRIPWSGTADYRGLVFRSIDATDDGVSGRFPIIHNNLTDGFVQYNIGRLGVDNPQLGGFYYRHGAVQQYTPFDWQNDGKGGFSSKEFLAIHNHDSGGGAVFSGKQRRSDHSSGIKLHAIRNNVATQTEWQAGALYLTANRYDRNATPQSQLLGNEENVFTVANNDSVRLTLKGDGRLVTPNCSIGMIQGSSTNKVLTTKEYVDSLIGATNSNTYTKAESDSRFVNITGDIMSGNLDMAKDRPLISLTNLQQGYNTSFGLHVSSNNFYILKNDPAITNSANGWDPIYPLELRTSNNQGYIFGDMVLHEGNMEYFSVDGRKISQGTWWNNGFLRADAGGVTELGKAIDFHYDATDTSNDWNYRIEAYSIPAFATYGLKFVNNNGTSLDIKGNHIHAPNADVAHYLISPDSGKMLTTKEYVDHILDGNIINVTDQYDENVPKIVRKTGWRKINGTIIQWGSVISQDLRTVTFPRAFNNACTSVQITRNHRKVWTYGNEVYTSGITKTKFDFEISGHDGSWQDGYECTWIAIGY